MSAPEPVRLLGFDPLDPDLLRRRTGALRKRAQVSRSMELLERQAEQGLLEKVLAQVMHGDGQIALISGEAGIGKTSLVTSFVRKHRSECRVLWGACDPLFTPRPLGPLHDIALGSRPDLADLLNSGANWLTVSSALLKALQDKNSPSILVLEDIHWADEATLDLCKFLGRRIRQTHALLILTYRDDEVHRQHPLRSVLGDCPPGQTHRLPLAPLTETAVEALAGEAGRAAAGIFDATLGNPFFVTEVLKNEQGRVPETVRDAVLTRVARLAPSARSILDLLSVVPGNVDLWLVDSILSPDASDIDACIVGGFLVLTRNSLAFRHELARIAIAESLADRQSKSLHDQVLYALIAHPESHPPLALLVHHAIHSGNEQAVQRYAPLAAQEASRHGAHREAARYDQAALESAHLLESDARAALLDDLSFECYLTGKIEQAIQARHEAISIWRAGERRERVGDGLRWLSRFYWFYGKRDEAEEYAEQAIEILEQLTPGLELAMAYSNRSQLFVLAEQTRPAREWGAKALALAEEINSTDVLIHALTNIGTAELMDENPTGRETLDRALALARAHELHDHVARYFANSATLAVQQREYATAEGYLNEGIAYTTDRDMDSYSVYLRGWRARSLFERGQWAQAAAEAEKALGLQPGSAVIALPAIIALGHLRARQGSQEAMALLDRAQALALPTRELQRIGPLAEARTEAAWWQGDRERALAEARSGYDLALQGRQRWLLGSLAYWIHRAGGEVAGLERIPPVYRLMIEGDWRAAASEWEQIGCPFERALALAEGDREAQLTALSIFDELGARPAARALRQKMRRAGVKGIPRGPRPVTRANPAGLTAREMQVLALISEGLSNAAIAQRLSLSAKTVDHYVSSILSKLNVHTRVQAASIARKQSPLN